MLDGFSYDFTYFIPFTVSQVIEVLLLLFFKYNRIQGFEKGGVLQLGGRVRRREKKGDRKA